MTVKLDTIVTEAYYLDSHVFTLLGEKAMRMCLIFCPFRNSRSALSNVCIAEFDDVGRT